MGLFYAAKLSKAAAHRKKPVTIELRRIPRNGRPRQVSEPKSADMKTLSDRGGRTVDPLESVGSLQIASVATFQTVPRVRL
jgi:hypothetical protein